MAGVKRKRMMYVYEKYSDRRQVLKTSNLRFIEQMQVEKAKNVEITEGKLRLRESLLGALQISL